MGRAAASASQKVQVYGLFPLSFISLTAPFSSSKQHFSTQSGSSQAEIHDRHVWLCLCLLPPHLWGVGLGSVVGAGLIRDGVCPCVGFVRGRQRGLRRWGRTSTSAGATPCSSSAVQRPLLACNYPLLQAKSGIRFLIRGCLHGERAYEFLSWSISHCRPFRKF